MQFRLSNSQQYLVNANPDTNHSTNPTNLVTVIGDTNPTTNYWYEFDNLNCIFAYEEFILCLVNVCIRCFILH